MDRTRERSFARGCRNQQGLRAGAVSRLRPASVSATLTLPRRFGALPFRGGTAGLPVRRGRDSDAGGKTFELHPQFQPFQGNLVHFHTERWLRGAHSARLSADFRYGPDQSLLGEPSERLFVGPDEPLSITVGRREEKVSLQCNTARHRMRCPSSSCSDTKRTQPNEENR